MAPYKLGAGALSGASGLVEARARNAFLGLGHDLLNLNPTQDTLNDQPVAYAPDASGNLIDAMTDKAHLVDQWMASACASNPACAQAMAQYEPLLAGAIGDWSQAPASIVQTPIGQEMFKPYNVSIQHDGSLLVDQANFYTTVREQFSATYDRITSGFVEAHSTLVDTNAILGQNPLTVDQATQQAASARAAKGQSSIDSVFKDASADVNYLAAIVSIVSPTLGKDIKSFGGAAINVLQGGSKLVGAVNLLEKGFSAATALGCAAATGNFIGAAIQLVSLFTGGSLFGGGPDVNQLILQKIADLQDQMVKFQNDVDARFNRVDATLRTIYTNVNAQLQLIEWEQGKTLDKLANIENALLNQAAALMGLEEQLLVYFQVLERGELMQNVDNIWNRKASGIPFSAAKYADLESFLHEWAASKGEVWADIEQPVSGRQTAYEHLTDELNAPYPPPSTLNRTLYDNLSFLKQVLVNNNIVPDDDTTNPRLPNLQTWSIVAATYAKLQADWPQFATLADPATLQQRRSDVAQGGQAVADYLRFLLGNKSVFQALIDTYTGFAAALGQSFDAHVPVFMQDRYVTPGVRLPTDPVLDLWQGPTQRSSFVPPALTTITASPNAFPKGEPINNLTNVDHAFLRRLVPVCFVNADWFTIPKQSKLSATFRLDWGVAKRHYIWQPCGDADPPVGDADPRIKRCREEYDDVALEITVYVYYDNTMIARTTAMSDHIYPFASPIPPLAQAYTDDMSKLQNRLFATGMDDFESWEQAAIAPLIQQVTATVESELEACRADFYKDLALTESAGLGSDKDGSSVIATAAAQVDGSRSLLAALIPLVFEQASSGDDVIRALLHGPALIDDGIRLPTLHDIQDALLQLRTGAPPFPEPADPNLPGPMEGWLTRYVAPSVQRLKDRLAAWQDRYTAGTYDEWYVYAEQAQRRLTLSSTVVQLGTMAVSPTLPNRSCAFVRQSVPEVMVAGHRYDVTITMRNEGAATWQPGGLHADALGAQHPRDNTTWGHNRVKLPFVVAPAAEAVFLFTVTAPKKPGRYHFQWRMVQEHVGWFGMSSPDVVVTVR